jgi:imidazolonepropionase-like amidohydrolase
LEAITIDAAHALGVETQRGVISAGRRADFAVLDRNPLTTPAEAWSLIVVEAAAPSAAPSD